MFIMILFMKIFSCLSIPAQVINGCNDAEMQMNELVESRVAFFESLAHKVHKCDRIHHIYICL